MWSMLYYFEGCPSWSWYYKYSNAPLLSDIYEYMNDNQLDINNVEFKLGKPLDSILQLACVIPPSSFYLLPFENQQNLKKNMTSSNFKILFPTKFSEEIFNKEQRFLAIPKLPPLDIEGILSMIY